MRLRRFRMQWLGAVLALIVFAGWIGAGSLHEHPGHPSCQVCKLLHGGDAEIVNPVQLPAIQLARQATEQAADEPSIAATPSTPPGRAPPLA